MVLRLLLVHHQGLTRIADAIRRPARGMAVLGHEQSTGLFVPFGFSPLMLIIRITK